jgi:hypothetical protein
MKGGYMSGRDIPPMYCQESIEENGGMRYPKPWGISSRIGKR